MLGDVSFFSVTSVFCSSIYLSIFSKYFVNKVRTKFNLRGIWILNRVVGSIVMLVSLAGLIFTLLGESLY